MRSSLPPAGASPTSACTWCSPRPRGLSPGLRRVRPRHRRRLRPRLPPERLDRPSGGAARARGLGVGKALFDEILRHLVDSGKWPIYLVATEMGAPLYAKFGFVHDGGWTRWEFPHGAEPNLAAVAALGASLLGISVLPIEDGHLSRLVQFDTERFGDDRGQLLELVSDVPLAVAGGPPPRRRRGRLRGRAARRAWGPSWRSPRKPRRRSWRACCACLHRRGRPGST